MVSKYEPVNNPYAEYSDAWRRKHGYCEYSERGVCVEGCNRVCERYQRLWSARQDATKEITELRMKYPEEVEEIILHDAPIAAVEAQRNSKTTQRLTRASFMEEVAKAAGSEGDRQTAYGDPEDNFKRIARHWIAYFKNRFDVDVPLLEVDVALMMDLMKTARLEHNIAHHDSWVDKAGYSVCGAVCAANIKEEE